MQQSIGFPVQVPSAEYLPTTRSTGGAHGVVLTKLHVVDLMLDLVRYDESSPIQTWRLLEPSCGHGAFVVPAVRRLLRVPGVVGAGTAAIADRIVAFDVLEESVQRTRQEVHALLTSAGFAPADALELAEHWVRSGDFLLQEDLGHFDIIVGNPPYVRIEEFSKRLQALYRERYTTIHARADLYIPFIERSLELLSPQGRLSFICSNRWVKNQYGAALRSFITAQFNVEAYIDLETASPFEEEVTAYPSIFVMTRASVQKTLAASLTEADPAECNALRRGLRGEPTDVAIDVYSTWFGGEQPWSMAGPENLEILRMLEARCTPLEHGSTRVRIGVATGADAIFINGGDVDVEDDRKVPLVKRHHLHGGRIDWDGTVVVDPGHPSGRGLVDLQEYPRLRAFMEEHEERLRRRHVARRNTNQWYRTIDRIDRSLLNAPKLLIPDIAGALEATYEPGGLYPHHNLYFITSTDWDLEVLGALLSSTVAAFFVSCYSPRMRGGYMRYQAQHLRRICLPAPSEIDERLAGQLGAAFRSRDFATIDELSCKAWGLAEPPALDWKDTRS